MIYYILLVIYGVMCLSNKKESASSKKMRTIIVLGLPLFLLSAFRDTSIGPDTSAYFNTFNYISRFSRLTEAIVNSRMEPGYVALNYAFSHLNLSFYCMQFFISGFISFSIGYLIYYNSESVSFSYFFYLANHLFFGTMNVVRMWIAVAILIFSISAIKNGRFFHFCLIVFLATSFHYSALLFFVMYPFSRRKISYKKVSIIFIVSIVIWQFAMPFFTFITSKIGLYENYLTDDRFNMSENIAVKLTLLISAFFFIIVSFTRGWEKEGAESSNTMHLHEYSIAYNAMILAVSINIIGLSNNIMGRIVHYFSIFSLILIPHSINKVKKEKNRSALNLCILSILFAKYAVIMIYRPEWYMVTPYKSFLFN